MTSHVKMTVRTAIISANGRIEAANTVLQANQESAQTTTTLFLAETDGALLDKVTISKNMLQQTKAKLAALKENISKNTKWRPRKRRRQRTQWQQPTAEPSEATDEEVLGSVYAAGEGTEQASSTKADEEYIFGDLQDLGLVTANKSNLLGPLSGIVLMAENDLGCGLDDDYSIYKGVIGLL